jgi:hypothetical protein
MGMTNKPDCKRLTICAAPDLATAFGIVRVNPGDSLDYQQSAHVVTHCAPAFDQPALAGDPSFLFPPYHRLSDLDCLGFLAMAATETKLFFVGAIRSI